MGSFKSKMERMDWPEIMDEVRAGLRSEKIRLESSKFDAATVSSVEKQSGGKVLYTNFAFYVYNMSGRGLSFGKTGHEKAVITMRHEGLYDGMDMHIPGSGSQNDTEAFRWIQSPAAGLTSKPSGYDRVDINKELLLPILHPHKKQLAGEHKDMKDLLGELPPITITVMMLNGDDVDNANPGLDKTTAEVVHEVLVAEEVKSRSFPRARAAWVGQLPLLQAIEMRKAVNSKGIMIEMTGASDKSKKAVLECSVRVNRKPLLPVWGRVMSRVVANGSSTYFERRILQMLESVKEETEMFQSAIRDKRVSLFQNFNRAANNQKSDQVSAKKTDESLHQQELHAIFQAEDDAEEGSGTFAGMCHIESHDRAARLYVVYGILTRIVG